MALINCPNCGKTISDRAVKCPHCGAVFNKTSYYYEEEPKGSNKTWLYVLLGVVAAAVIGTVAWFGFKYIGQNNNKAAADSVAVDSVDADTTVVDTIAKMEEAPKVDSTKIKLEEFKSFRSADLSAFMLHGKVKSVTEYSGQCFTRCSFNKSGRLVKYEIGDNHSSEMYEISHYGSTLGITQPGTLGTWGWGYDVKGNKLVKYESGGDGVGDRCVYSNFDSNGWPRTETWYEYDMEEDAWILTSTKSVKYGNIDKYGNWQEKVSNGDMEARDIEYYPIE